MALLRIGDVTIDTGDGVYTSASGRGRLEPQVMCVLGVLVSHAGELVPHDVLIAEAWPDTHVAPGALARTISVLRRAFGDAAKQPRYIETIPKRGYRLIALVDRVDAAAHTAPVEAPAPAIAVKRRWIPFAAFAASSTAAVAIMFGYRENRLVNRETMLVSLAKPPVAQRFDHHSRVGNETALAYYTDRIAAGPSSAAAYAGLATAYVFRANYLSDRERWATLAVDAATRATTIEPGSPLAISSLASAQFQSGHLREAEALYRRALDVCPDDEASRANLGRVLLVSGRVADALPLFEHVVAAWSDSADGYSHLAAGLATAGHLNEAGDAARAALAIAPFDLDAQLILVKIDLLGNRLDAARERLLRLIDVYPDCTTCEVQVGLIAQLGGDAAAAAARYERAQTMSPPSPAAALRLAQLRVLDGRREEAERLLAEVEIRARAALARSPDLPMPRWHLATAAAVRGDVSAGLRWYGDAVAAGRRDGLWDRWDPLLAPLRSSPEFEALQRAFVAEHEATTPVARRVSATLARTH